MCGAHNMVHMVKQEDGSFQPTCTCCGNTDTDKMSYAYRTCGYISSYPKTNKGRSQDVGNRYKHFDNVVCD